MLVRGFDDDDLARMERAQGRQNFRHKWGEVGELVGRRTQDDDAERQPRRVLLRGQVLIDRDERLVVARNAREQLAVDHARPASLLHCRKFVPDQQPAQPARQALVQQPSSHGCQQLAGFLKKGDHLLTFHGGKVV